MTHEEARKIAEEYARSVPDDVHIPTLTQKILSGEFRQAGDDANPIIQDGRQADTALAAES